MRKTAGFSLVEIVCVLVILGVLGAFASQGLSRFINLYTSVKEVDAATQQAQIAMNRLFIEITRINTAATGSLYIMDDSGVETPKTEYKFPSLEGTSTPLNNVVLYVPASKLLKLNGASICENVTTFSMEQNPSGATVANLDYIVVTMTVAVGGKTQTLKSQIALKKLSGS
jgi:prepilin-type N-terminal cleavage/methylation domain-containing protein